MFDPFLPGLLFRLPETPRKIALVRASRIGDFVCATPAFRAIRNALPLAEISLIAMPFVAELVNRSPQIDRFIPFPGFLGMAEPGPAHIAYALSTPTVTIFGGTDPQVWGSLNTHIHKTLLHKVPCHPCDRAPVP